MAVKKSNPITTLRVSAEIEIEIPKMIPRFLKEFKHPTFGRLRNIEAFKVALLSDILQLKLQLTWEGVDEGFYDLSDLYLGNKDCSYYKETFAFEADEQVKGFVGTIELLGDIKITKIDLSK